MSNYEKIRDSLICEKNDSIDNAAHEVINAIVKEADDEEIMEAVKDLAEALMPEGQELPVITDEDNGQAMENTIDLNELTVIMKRIISKWGIPKPAENEDVEWDMYFIGDVTDIMESELDKKCIGICHPFFCNDEDAEDDEHYDEDNDGVLCFLSSDKCAGCQKCIQED